MNNFRRAGVILATAVLGLGALAVSSPASARDTSWGGWQGGSVSTK